VRGSVRQGQVWSRRAGSLNLSGFLMPQDPDSEKKPATTGRFASELGQWVASEALGNALVPLLSWTFRMCGNVLGWMLELLTF